MNKTDLVARIAEELGMKRSSVRKVVDATLHTIKAAIAEGEKVRLSEFGTLEKRKCAARSVRSPSTGEMIRIPAFYSVKFNPSKVFKQVAGGKIVNE